MSHDSRPTRRRASRCPYHTGVSRPELPLLFRDERLVVVHKPSGLLVHRTSLDAGERSAALQILRRQLRRRVYPVHRLDKGASGALVFALDEEAAAALAALVRTHAVERTYLAVVRGHMAEAGVIDRPLARHLDPVELRERAARRETKEVVLQPAVTAYRRLATAELPHRVDRYPTSRYSLVELRPRTGRRHQLRRHLATASHPIVGDSTHGVGRHNRLFERLFGSRRLLLACVRLGLPHPVTGEPLVVDAPLADDFARVVEALGWTEAVAAARSVDSPEPGILG
jgi:tRNA pseudouridine65 synthase